MMRPHLRSRMPSITGRVTLNTELRLVVMTSFHCCGGHAVEGGVAGDAGVVDEDVDRAELRARRRAPSPRHCAAIGDVALDERARRCRVAHRAAARRAPWLRRGSWWRPVAHLGQALDDRRADAAGAAGDQCDAALHAVFSLPARACAHAVDSRHVKPYPDVAMPRGIECRDARASSHRRAASQRAMRSASAVCPSAAQRATQRGQRVGRIDRVRRRRDFDSLRPSASTISGRCA